MPYKDPEKKREAAARYRKKNHDKILEKQRIFSKEIVGILSSVITTALLVVTLFPLNTGFTLSSYSRLRDLLSVPEDNSLRHWQDLTDYLEANFDYEVVVSDPVTGYIITATTDSISPRYKFTSKDHAVINFQDYADDPFQRYSGNLLVINLRDGGLSRTGAESGHWREDVLKVQQYYSDELLAYIDSEPERLSMLWQENSVSVYRVQ